MGLIERYYKIPDWALTVASVVLYCATLFFVGRLFESGVSVSIATPVFCGVILSLLGGSIAGAVNAAILTYFTFYYVEDTSRLQQNLLPNIIMVVGAGAMSSWARYQYRLASTRLAKSELLDRANGNLLRLEAALKWVDIALDNYDGNRGDPANKTMIALTEARGILADLQTMVKGWRVLYREKHEVIHGDSERDKATN